MQILFVYIYNEINSRPRRHMRRKRSMLCQKRCCSFSGVLRKFPCFLEIDILFILNYKSGTKLAKIYSTGNAVLIPTYNQKNKRTCQKYENRMNEKRMRSYLPGLRINSTLIFMSSSSYLVHAISCRRILLKYRVL